jgi:hypothetical protein
MLKLATKFPPQRAALEMAYGAGYRFAEFWLDAKLLSDVHALARLARAYPLRYALHFPNALRLAPETVKHAAHLARTLESTCLVIHQPMFDQFCVPLLEADPKIRLAIENHKLSEVDFTRWAERNPGLALDVEHLWKFTLHDAPLPRLLEAVRHFLENYREKLRHVHLPGYWPGFDEHRPMYCARELVLPVLSLLEEFHFTGLVVSEVDSKFQNLYDLRMDVLLFDAWRFRDKPS